MMGMRCYDFLMDVTSKYTGVYTFMMNVPFLPLQFN